MNTLHKAVHDYIEMRRSLGFKLNDAERRLRKFIAFLDRHSAPHITVALALQWAQENPSARPCEWARRLSLVRGFARYWSATDPRTEIPLWGLLPHRPCRARPYLYSDEEIRLLLEAALQLPSLHGLPGETYHCLLGLLPVTGLRISEALNLRSEDVDLKEGVLTIRGTKFGLAGRPASFFFISRRGTRLTASRVRCTFYTLCRRTGLRGIFASHGPRLHGFRHRSPKSKSPTDSDPILLSLRCLRRTISFLSNPTRASVHVNYGDAGVLRVRDPNFAPVAPVCSSCECAHGL
jgi:integrase/recombinase XerD